MFIDERVQNLDGKEFLREKVGGDYQKERGKDPKYPSCGRPFSQYN